jgi:orotidine-5'-phosphate decarboxylase
MEAAVKDKGDLKILAVTVLTSLDRGDLDDLGFSCDVEKLVLSRARRALAAGVDGIVSSGLEAPMIRRELGEKLMVVTPGIRPVENKPTTLWSAGPSARPRIRARRHLASSRPSAKSSHCPAGEPTDRF